jgi:asparagine synthase (glutamine-hydrolysing)
MSAQFGRWNLDGRPVSPDYLEKAGRMLAPYGPDGEGTYIKDGAGILFRAFHTTREARNERQPRVLAPGAVLTWDGRLDNRTELIGKLNGIVTAKATDAEIVAAAYEEWGTDCLAKLLGDWALAIWNPRNRSLLLAKDFAGTRHLFYSLDREQVTWSTILDHLVLLAGKTFALEEEYIAGWLSFFPATHLTPYVGIHSVPPACFASITPQGKSIHKYWDFDPKKRIRYRTDGEYEEHFRQVFRESVRRRLRSDSPVLAELSGGMDSSSIVCMADEILARGEGETPRLDTVSYYNDAEPNWNEKPYFTKVEEKRGRSGCHIDVGKDDPLRFELEPGRFAATPGASVKPCASAREFTACLLSQGNRVVLSGIGGDEVTGGVPTPVPELMDLIARARFGRLARQLKVWALNKRKPWFHLFFEALREFLPASFASVPRHLQPTPWLRREFTGRYRAALAGYPARVKLLGPLPSFQENLSTFETLRRQLAHTALSPEPVHAKRYPHLDRDLLEFLYSVPREQLVKPGARRSLMRRALRGIVPDGILDRKRKAFVVRGPMTTLASHGDKWVETFRDMNDMLPYFLDMTAFSKAIENAREGQNVFMIAMIRMLGAGFWLKQAADRGFFREVAAREAGENKQGWQGRPFPSKGSAS